MGTKFEFRNITLHRSDVLDDVFDKPFADLIVTSPPYNLDIPYNNVNDDIPYNDYLDFFLRWLIKCYGWSNDRARFCLNIPLDYNLKGHQPLLADSIKLAQKAGWKYKGTIIWNKQQIKRRSAWGSWMSASAPTVIAFIETILVLYKNEWKKEKGNNIDDIEKEEFLQWTNGIWAMSAESGKRIGHPAPFPIELPKRCIKLFSFQNEVVFDPFVGSGTTLIAAEKLNRKSVGIDIDPEYFDLAKKRIRKEIGSIEF